MPVRDGGDGDVWTGIHIPAILRAACDGAQTGTHIPVGHDAAYGGAQIGARILAIHDAVYDGAQGWAQAPVRDAIHDGG